MQTGGGPREESVDLRAYLALLRARKWTIILVTLLVFGAALAWSYQQQPVYAATARVYLEPLTSEQMTAFGRVDVATQSQVAASEPVAVRVKEDLGFPGTARSLLGPLSAEALTETQIIILRYTSTDPALTAAAANSFAENFLDFRSEREQQNALEEQRAIERRVQTASAQLTEVTQQLEDAQDSGDDALAATLDTQRNILTARLGVLQQRLDDVQSQSSGQGGGEVIEEATTPSVPVSPNHRRNGGLGLILGLAIGTGLAFLRERLDDRFKGRADVEVAVRAPVVGTIPRYQRPRGASAYQVISAADPQGAAAEAYRALRTNVQFITSQRGIKSLVVTSPSAAEGKSATSSNLGVVLAQAGRRVILVSADLRRPTLGNYFGIQDQAEQEGLSAYLSGAKTNVVEVIRDPGIPNMRIVPSGVVPPNPAELLSSPLLGSLVRSLEEIADFVIVDSAPVLAVADAAVIASQVGGALLVIDASKTHRSATVHSKQELERTGGAIIGCVLNAFDPGDRSYYYSAYSYGRYGESPGGNGVSDRSRSKRRSKQRGPR
ncbi:MAG TPA: polysaccharide biosynthesis tyrosine autokinase [Actinomycetota bacterium]|nr:polysaccharide biosynthesis tyrosine autokinase [Actinomycetota bacterium]